MKEIDYISTEEELRELAKGQRELAEKYLKIRKEYGEAKWELMLLLAPELKHERYRKASSQKQILMLMSEALEVHKTYIYKVTETYTKSIEDYKGLQRLIDANGSRISTLQSLMRYARSGGG